jgi:hypothetical protein
MQFKQCPKCGYEWNKRIDFLSDPDIEVIGYQANLEAPNEGLYLFNHNMENCRSTISIITKHFFDLHKDKIHLELKFKTPECEGLCLKAKEMNTCRASCSMAHFRSILRVLVAWPKKAT